jgi:hypothetical protein
MATAQGQWTVRFLGQNIWCDEPRDAVALQRASDILNEVAAYHLTLDELNEITRVLLCYSQFSAIRKLKERAQISAAAQDGVDRLEDSAPLSTISNS